MSIIITKTAMRKVFKPAINTIIPSAFSTLKIKSHHPVKMPNNHDTHKSGYMVKDAARVFQQFLKSNPPKESERSFFDMGYHEKEETFAFDPFKTLGLQPTNNKQKIKQAYRDLAMKYHPKKNSSIEAGEKFVQITMAYEMLNPEQITIPKKKGLSFMTQFNNKAREYMNSEAGIKTSSVSNTGKSQEMTAELYTESKYIKRLGDKKQVKIEKQYNRNGNVMKITRLQLFHEDGSVQISETYDDGSDVIHKFTQQQQSLQLNTPISGHISWKDNLFAGSYELKDDKAKKDQKQKPKEKKQDKKDSTKQKKDNKDKKPKA